MTDRQTWSDGTVKAHDMEKDLEVPLVGQLEESIWQGWKIQKKDAEEYLNGRWWIILVMLSTSLSMGAIGVTSWFKNFRILDEAHAVTNSSTRADCSAFGTNGSYTGPNTHDDDVRQTWSTVFLNFYIAVFLMLNIGYNRTVLNNFQRKVDEGESDEKLQKRWELEGLTSPVITRGNNYNRYYRVLSGLSLLMPLQGVLTICYWPNIPASRGDCLPDWVNSIFIVGIAAYMIVLLYLAVSAMARPLRATLNHRQDVIDLIHDAQSADDWENLSEELAKKDHKLNSIWALRQGGLIWVTAIFGSVVLALTGMYNLIAEFGQYGVWVVVHDHISTLYLFIGVAFALMLGLLLASASFVRPFRFPKIIHKGITNMLDANTPKRAETTNRAEELNSDCVLATAVFSHTNKKKDKEVTSARRKTMSKAGTRAGAEAFVESVSEPKAAAAFASDAAARTERLRFLQCAQLLTLGARLLGITITKDLVMKLYVQIGIALPAALPLLRTAVLGHQQQ